LRARSCPTKPADYPQPQAPTPISQPPTPTPNPTHQTAVPQPPTPTQANPALQRLNALIASVGLEVRPVRGDGNCLVSRVGGLAGWRAGCSDCISAFNLNIKKPHHNAHTTQHPTNSSTRWRQRSTEEVTGALRRLSCGRGRWRSCGVVDQTLTIPA